MEEAVPVTEPVPGERWRRRLAAAAAIAFFLVGVVALVLGPGLFLIVRPFVDRGAGVLGFFGLVIGLGAIGLLHSAVTTRGALVGAPPSLGRSLGLGTAAAAITALPGLGWDICVMRYVVAGKPFFEYEWVAAAATAVLALPLGATLLGATAWIVCRRHLARWAPARGANRGRPGVMRRATLGVALAFLGCAWLWPGGPSGPGAFDVAATDEDMARVLRDRATVVARLEASLASEQGVRWHVAQWLGRLVDLGDEIAPLLKFVAVRDSQHFFSAMVARAWGREAQPLTTGLIRGLGGPTDWHLDMTTRALRSIGAEARADGVRTLVRNLPSKDPMDAIAAGRACIQLCAPEPPPSEVFAALELQSAAGDWEVRGEAIRALRDVRPLPPWAVTLLLLRLRDTDSRVMMSARDGLAAAARSDATVVERCLAALTGAPDADDRILDSLCLGGVAVPQVLEWAEAQLVGPKRGPAWMSWRIRRLGASGAPLLTSLDALLGGLTGRDQIEVALAALVVGGATEERLAPVRKTLTSLRPTDAWTVLRVLGESPGLISHLEPELVGLLTSPDDRSRVESASLLLLAGLRADDVVPLLDRTICSLGPRVLVAPYAAAQGARRAGLRARDLLPALRDCRDRGGFMHEPILDAIEAIEAAIAAEAAAAPAPAGG